MSNDWTENDIPDQTGRVAIVTGANSGIGYDTARALAQKGATVVLACRSADKAEAAAEQILALSPSGAVENIALDLSDLDSVRAFADEFRSRYTRLDLLINNAGVMMPPLQKTPQGFELQFGVNHLGHFVLTALLVDLATTTAGSRIVNVSSTGHRFGKIDFDNLSAEQSYSPRGAYSQSKLANLLFTYELQRRLQTAGYDTLSVAAHPGWTATNLQQHASGVRFLNRFLAQTSDMGALPTLRAAVDPAVGPAEYYGPSRRWETIGYPKKVGSNKRSHDRQTALRLWEVSEEMTGVTFDALIEH